MYIYIYGHVDDIGFTLSPTFQLLWHHILDMTIWHHNY